MASVQNPVSAPVMFTSQGFSPELLIMPGRLPLMDAGSDPAFEMMAQSQQGP